MRVLSLLSLPVAMGCAPATPAHPGTPAPAAAPTEVRGPAPSRADVSPPTSPQDAAAKACLAADAAACTRHALNLSAGLGTPKDCATALRLWTESCAKDEPYACELLSTEEPCAPDENERIRFAERACALDRARGCSELAKVHLAAGRRQDARAAFKRGCSLESQYSCEYLAHLDKGSPVPTLQGCLTQPVVLEVVGGSAPRVRACYERELTRNPGLEGKITTEFAIDPHGQVNFAGVISSDMPRSATERCVLEEVAQLRFPPCAGGGTAHITYPWIFRDGSKQHQKPR